MVSTTLFILFNSYRAQITIDTAIDSVTSWPKKLLSSNLSIGLLLGASVLLICGVLVATISTGGLALPVVAFTTGIAAAFSSLCTLSAISLFGIFAMLTTASLLSEQQVLHEEHAHPKVRQSLDNSFLVSRERQDVEDKNFSRLFLIPQGDTNQQLRTRAGQSVAPIYPTLKFEL